MRKKEFANRRLLLRLQGIFLLLQEGDCRKAMSEVKKALKLLSNDE